MFFFVIDTNKAQSEPHQHRKQVVFRKASYHQGNTDLFHQNSVGRQCVPNCLMACIMSKIKDPCNWTVVDMNCILYDGDKLYRTINAGQDLLLPSDLPMCVHKEGKIFYIARGKEAVGSLSINPKRTETILYTLCNYVHSIQTSAIICLGDQRGSSAIAVLSLNTCMYIFDSHSRDQFGMPHPNGTAVLMKFYSVEDTVSYICQLAYTLSAELFHLTFFEAVYSSACECDTSYKGAVSSNEVLHDNEIMKLFAAYAPKQNKRNNYYKSYRKRSRTLEAPEDTANRRQHDRIYKASTKETETKIQTERRKLHEKQRKASARHHETHEQTTHRRECDKQGHQDRVSRKVKGQTIDDARNNFKSECKKQPVFICTSCHRLLWKKGVQKFDVNKYNRVQPEIRNIVLHNNYRISSIDGLIYICHNCHRTLKSNKVPAQSKANDMDLEEIPDELSDLNNLELHIICKRILFMKLVKLPRGKQKGIKGAAVNVPADLGPACTLLPRIPSDAHLISLKLKRKLEYRQAYLHDTIRPEKVLTALNYLKSHNPMYADIKINENWIEIWKQQDEELYDGIFIESTENATHGQYVQESSSTQDMSNSETSDTEIQVVHDSKDNNIEDIIALEENCKLRDLPFDTCLQNELHEEPDQIFSIAPGEGKRPIPLLTDTLFEELANPDKFPSGKGGFADTQRDTKLTLRKYVNARLLDQDGRFARDIEYLFGMQYAVEHKQVSDCISIALRQTRGRHQFGKTLDAGMLKNSQQLHNLLKKDRAYSFLKNVRGSPPYWQKMFFEVLSMIRTLGIPTWFLTLSAADMKWPEVIQAIAKQYGVIYTDDEVSELPWRRKSMWLRSNPVTAARMFQHRLDSFITTFLKSTSEPIGPLSEYVIRIEFQARGSPHAHTLIWIKDAPKLGYSDEADVIKFINKYVSCALPSTDEALRDLVENLQIHRHSQTCRRKGSCRFNYPKPPSPLTIISDEPTENCQEKIDFAVKTLTVVKDTLEENESCLDITLEEILNTANVSLENYIEALSISKSGRSVILKRQPSEQFVNCYSPSILKAWEANMDIQYVVNAYACVMYIASYVLKAEKGMGELLKQAAKEIEQGNIRQQLNKLGSVFLTNREVSAQEAVYRVLSMPLRRCSRTVIFLNTDSKECRDALLLPLTQLQKLEDEDKDVYCKNIIDRYAARPDNLEGMCLAEFAANYTYNHAKSKCMADQEGSITGDSEIDLPCDSNDIGHATVITLQNGLGRMRKRKRKAIVRWHNFNIEKESEKHFRSRIMLFLPWRSEDTLQGNYISYEDRHNDEIEQIKAKEGAFIHHEEDINDAFKLLQTVGVPQAAWDTLAPGTEEDQEIALHEGITDERPMADEDIQAHVDQIINEKPQSRNDSLNLKYTKEAQKQLLNPKEYNYCMQQLNEEQRTIVMYHRKWCKETVFALKQNKPVKPYCLFLSGSGGVGKSFVVKMLHTDTVKLLKCARQLEPDDVPILLTAATGVAAHNISGITVHSAFMLNDRRKAGTTYIGLGADTLSTLQMYLEQLMVVIIDEISMIGAETLYKIHMRLQQIKGLQYSNTRFGNVTMIAVGDLYQLPPLKDKKIYDVPGSNDDPNPIRLHGSLWQENFLFHELKQVVRQKDQEFAELLNRVREGKMTEIDEAKLQTRVTTLDDKEHFTDALHVYGTNQQTDDYNRMMLHKLNTTKYTIKSSNITKDRDTLQVKVNLDGKKRADTGGLVDILIVAESAFVRLTSNIDVADGLANGVRGIITKIITNEKGSVTVILVTFDDVTIGVKAKASSQFKQLYPNCVPIFKYGVPFQHKNITVFRSQFPLVLSWASTIHAVQGLTVDKIVVDLSKIFAAGQAYVALSRVRTFEGLQILNFKRSAFRKDSRAENEMIRLQSRAITFHWPAIPDLPNEEWIKICHLNVRGYLNHLNDCQKDVNFDSADILCFTETHLRHSDVILEPSYPKKHMVLYRRDRVRGVDKGGVMMFINKSIKSRQLNVDIPELEYIGSIISVAQEQQLVILTIYRRSVTVGIQKFINMLKKLLSSTVLYKKNVLVLGDFNEDILQNNTKIYNFFKQLGFQQLIHQPTTDQGSLLDHVYFNRHFSLKTEVCDTYYSDHDCTMVAIQKDKL